MRRRLPLDLTLVLLVVLCVVGAVSIVGAVGLGSDSHAYWLTSREDVLYSRAPSTRDAYLYSPAFAQLIWPLAQLPWPAFCVIFTVAPAVAFAWLLRPLPTPVAVACWLMTLPEIVTGNIYWLLALAAAVGLRHPASWTCMAMTKITPCLGPLWFLVRREWHSLAVSVLAILGVASISYVIQPAAWGEWISFLASSSPANTDVLGSPLFPPLVVRLPLGVALLVWGALGNRGWTLPVAMVLATPVIGPASFTMLCAIPRLRAAQRQPAPALLP